MSRIRSLSVFTLALALFATGAVLHGQQGGHEMHHGHGHAAGGADDDGDGSR